MSLSSLAYRYLLRTFSGHELGGIHALDGAEAAGEVACVTYPKVAVHEVAPFVDTIEVKLRCTVLYATVVAKPVGEGVT